MIGDSCYMEINYKRLRCNLWTAIVGGTGSGRKATARGCADAALLKADPEWAKRRIKCGLSSGEGLIEEINRMDGSEDKRLLVVEEELVSVFRVCKRDGNNLSSALRQASDSIRLAVMRRVAISADRSHI